MKKKFSGVTVEFKNVLILYTPEGLYSVILPRGENIIWLRITRTFLSMIKNSWPDCPQKQSDGIRGDCSTDLYQQI